MSRPGSGKAPVVAQKQHDVKHGYHTNTSSRYGRQVWAFLRMLLTASFR